MSRSSPNFNVTWFEEVVKGNWVESTNLDFKRSWEWHNEDAKFKLAKHLIAMANTAYRTGKETFIFYGVVDETHAYYDLTNVYPDRNALDQRLQRSDVYRGSLMEDGVRKVIQDEMKHWIDPPDELSFSLEYGEVSDDQEGSKKLVAYLRIAPPRDCLLRLSREFRVRKVIYYPGQIFIRKGSSSVSLDESQAAKLFKSTAAAYLKENEWRIWLNFHQSGEFSRAFEATLYYPSKFENADQPVEEVLWKDIQQSVRRIAILGMAGSGKTLLLQRISYRLAAAHGEQPCRRPHFAFDETIGKWDYEDEAEDLPVVHDILELETTLYNVIPFFYSLVGADFTTPDDIERLLERKACEILGRDLSLKSLWNIPGSKWILLLDALDEVNSVNTRARVLISWIRRLPGNIQVILTTRPFIISAEQDWETRKFVPLKDDEIVQLLRQRLESQITINTDIIEYSLIATIEMWLRKNTGMYPLLSSHRAHTVFAEYASEFIGQSSNQSFAFAADEPAKTISAIEESIHYAEETPPVRDENIENSLTVLTPFSIDAPESLLYAEVENVDLEGAFANSVNHSTESKEDSAHVAVWHPPLAHLLRALTDKIRFIEAKRKEWLDGQKFDQRAREQLEYLAWESDWETPEFNIIRAKEKAKQNGWVLDEGAFDWNENLGFLTRIQDSRKRCFVCSLYQHYAAAEYAYAIDILDTDARISACPEVCSLLRDLQGFLSQEGG